MTADTSVSLSKLTVILTALVIRCILFAEEAAHRQREQYTLHRQMEQYTDRRSSTQTDEAAHRQTEQHTDRRSST